MKDDGITRRDFVNGASVAIGGSLLAPWPDLLAAGFDSGSDYYPPARTGLRGTHNGAWETMHARVAGRTWPVGKAEEQYDLVIVGGGISGLAAAHLFRKQKPEARILILDNHDDFGGHAKRNEFTINGATRIGYGGTESIDTPSSYTKVAKQTLVDIGIDTAKFYAAFDQTLYAKLGLAKSILFDKENFGARKLVPGYGKVPWATFAAQAPLNEQARRDFIRVHDRGARLPARALPRGEVQRPSQGELRGLPARLLQGRPAASGAVPEVRDQLLVCRDRRDPGHLNSRLRWRHAGTRPYARAPRIPRRRALHLPLPRRQCVGGPPAGAVAHSGRDARHHDGGCGHGASRLFATRPARRQGSHSPQQHRRQRQAHREWRCRGRDVRAAAGERTRCAARMSSWPVTTWPFPTCVPSFRTAQKQGLSYGVKVPLTYTKVLIPNWRSFAQLGTDFVYYTKDFFKQVELDYPVSLGELQALTDARRADGAAHVLRASRRSDEGRRSSGARGAAG